MTRISAQVDWPGTREATSTLARVRLDLQMRPIASILDRASKVGHA
jgi:hypothetical protein